MLKPEDCLPGVEIICIKQSGIIGPKIQIGGEYSIKEFFPKGTIITSGLLKGIKTDCNSISLNEIPFDVFYNDDWSFLITDFKLKYDPEKLEIFKFKSQSVDKSKINKKEIETV